MSDADRLPVPHVEMVASPVYVAGLPMLVSLILSNADDGVTYNSVERGDLLSPPVTWEVTWTPKKGAAIVHAPGAGRYDGIVAGVPFPAGTRWRMLADLSSRGPGPPPGVYHLAVRVSLGSFGFTGSAKEVVEVVKPKEGEALIATLAQPGGWTEFLTSNWATIRPETLGPELGKALALHLFLQRAAYGPRPVAELSTAPLEAIDDPAVVGEAALLRYEIEKARKSDPQKLRREIEKKYPGLEWRLADIDAGRGRLITMRKTYGAESPQAQRFPTLPYSQH